MHSVRGIWFRLLLLLVLALLAGWVGPYGVSAQGQTVIAVMPPSAQVGVDQNTEVQVRVEDVAGLYGLDVRLTFDPSVIQVVDADQTKSGVQVVAGDLLRADFLIRNTADNSQGTVWFAVTQLNPTAEVDGSGTAFTVTFRGVRAASSPIQITYAKLVGRAGESISAVTSDGGIDVVAAGEAPPPTATTAANPPGAPTATSPASAPTPPTVGRTVAPATRVPSAETPSATGDTTSLARPTAAPLAPVDSIGNELSVPLILAGMAGVLVIAGGVFAVWLLRARAAE